MSTELLHGLPPLISVRSRVLILGSMPSAASLAAGFYYAHPQNRMWKIVALCCGLPPDALPDPAARRAAAEKLQLAFYDVIEQCVRPGSMDSAVRDPKPADIPSLLRLYPHITRIVLNGALTKKLFIKHFDLSKISPKVFYLPSTSPANARYSLQQLLALYQPVITCQNSP